MRVAALLAFAPAIALAQAQIGIDNPLRTGESQQAAVRVNDAIYLAYGFGNTFLVTTSAGNVEALRLTDVALASDPQFRPALEARLAALEKLHAKSKNSNERGWLEYHMRQVKKKLSG